jgi:hypothetical protein
MSPAGSSGGSPSTQARLAASKVRLLGAFAAAAARSNNVSIGALVPPFPAAELLRLGARFAHRLVGRGGIWNSDFDISTDADGTVTLRASPVKRGASFFVILSLDPDVIACAHAFQGADSTGCIAYSIANVPAELALTVDKVQVDASGAPVLLHASLAPVAGSEMTCGALAAVVEKWEGRALCTIAGAGGAADCHASSGECGHVGAGDCAADVTAVLKGAAVRLAALAAVRKTTPVGGSPL